MRSREPLQGHGDIKRSGAERLPGALVGAVIFLPGLPAPSDHGLVCPPSCAVLPGLSDVCVSTVCSCSYPRRTGPGVQQWSPSLALGVLSAYRTRSGYLKDLHHQDCPRETAQGRSGRLLTEEKETVAEGWKGRAQLLSALLLTAQQVHKST